MVDSALGIGSAYQVEIDKVYVCSGMDGHLPVFNPQQENYGCIADSPKLMYRFKIIVSVLFIIIKN